MRVIDFRLRAPYKSLSVFSDEKIIGPMTYRVGFEIPPSVKEKSMELLIQEMDENEVEIGVVPGRLELAGLPAFKNDDIAELVEKYPGRFVGFAIIDPRNKKQAAADVEKYIVSGNLTGIALEPGLVPDGEPYDIDSPEAFKVYELADTYHIPVLFTYSGGGVKHIGTDSINQFERAAIAFPNVKFIAGHGGWPYAEALVGLAYFNRNIYLSPDMYSTNFPGAEVYFQAARQVLQDQVIFGTAYPVIGFKDVLDIYKKQGFTENVLEKILYKNAATVLGLEE